jgi:hypothetical protein
MSFHRFGSVEAGPSFSREIFSGGLAPEEKAGHCGGRAAMKLALAEKGVAVSLA